MEIYYVTCPQCNGSFHRDADLMGFDIPLHCPHCDLYFEPEPEEKAKRLPRGTVFVEPSKFDRMNIYIPNLAKKPPVKA